MNNTETTTAPADTRNQFDLATEQSAAGEKLHQLAREETARSGRAVLAALAHVKGQHKRLAALAEGRFEDDTALAAAGEPHPLPHLCD